MTVQNRLATYGTLAPGRVNHRQLSDLKGEWSKGIVRGRLIEEGWGADHDCPGIILEEQGAPVEVFVFESPELPGHWDRLDAFEGREYRRVPVRVETDSEVFDAYIYELSSSIQASL